MDSSTGSGEPGRTGNGAPSARREAERWNGRREGYTTRELLRSRGESVAAREPTEGQTEEGAAVFHGSKVHGNGGSSRREMSQGALRLLEAGNKVRRGRTGHASVLRRKRTGGSTPEGPSTQVGSRLRKGQVTRQGDALELLAERQGGRSERIEGGVGSDVAETWKQGRRQASVSLLQRWAREHPVESATVSVAGAQALKPGIGGENYSPGRKLRYLRRNQGGVATPDAKATSRIDGAPVPKQQSPAKRKLCGDWCVWGSGSR